jgi:hypothetical protein
MKRIAGVRLTAVLSGVLAFLGACDSQSPVQPAAGVDVAVDSAVYHLQRFFSDYHVEIKSTITNSSDHDIFIGQDCGDGPRLRRSDPSDKRQLLLGEYACAASSQTTATPLRIAAGGQYTQTFKLDGSNSSQTRPPITIDDNTGSVAMTFSLTDAAGKVLANLASAAFTVVPPVPDPPGDTLRVTSGIGVREIPDSIIINRGKGHAFVTPNVRVYNRRSDPIGVSQCAMTIQQREGISWVVVASTQCPVSPLDRVLQPGDSSDFSLGLDDSSESQSLYNRQPLTSGTYDVALDVSIAGARQAIESNPFALFTSGFVLPNITGVLSPNTDNVSALVEEDPTDRGIGDRMTPKVQVVNLFSLIDRSAVHSGCVISVWYDKSIPPSGSYPQNVTASSAYIVRCPAT